jgi:hypothetical protein
MGKHTVQIPSSDGCIYIYDADRKTIRKVCDIEKPEDIPADVRETLRVAGLPIELR